MMNLFRKKEEKKSDFEIEDENEEESEFIVIIISLFYFLLLYFILILFLGDEYIQQLRVNLSRMIIYAESADVSLQREVAEKLANEAVKSNRQVQIVEYGGLQLLVPLTAKFAIAAIASILTESVEYLARRINPGIPPLSAILRLLSALTPKFANALADCL